jgi:type IV pilus assembly protein PilY1
MNIQKHLRWLGAAALGALCTSGAALADDTELFVGVPNAASQARPNILFVIDNSGSMATDVRTQPNYDPAQTYAGTCDVSRVYWLRGTGTPPSCSTTSQYFDAAALKCDMGVQALKSAGTYTDTMAQFNPSSNAKRWENISSSQHTRYVECKADYGKHGDGNPANAVYPKNGGTVPDDAWTATSPGTGNVVWGQSPADRVYTIYSGNYLNWLTGPTALKSRLEVVQGVATSLLNSISGVNVGLMTFNYEQGGYVVHAMEDIATARASLITSINALKPTSWTPLSETLYEAAMYYMGGNVTYGTGSDGGTSDTNARLPGNTSLYNSPLADSCQKNFIVYLTDGEPTHDSDAQSKVNGLKDVTGTTFSSLVSTGGTCDTETYPSGFNPDPKADCLDDLAEFLYKGDVSSLTGKQNVITYTIGFTVDLPILAETAARGGGAYYTADDTASLTTALSNIVTSILDTQTTFVSPTVAVNSFNRTQNLNDLFISVFKASSTEHWPGNLKKYRLRASDGMIIDSNNAPAVDPATGFFNDMSKSFWSAAADGANVEAGGAANKLPDPSVRQVYTYLGASTDLTIAGNRVAKTNTSLTAALLNAGATGEPTRDNVIDFVNGVDVTDVDQDNNITEPRNQMGDPLHSQPATVIYGPTLQDGVIYFATNDGFLHAIDSRTGVEKWAFIPPDFLGDQVDLLKNDSTSNKHYGIDGSLRVQMVADGDGIIESGEKVYLFFGVRRGGDVYYGLDVTNPNAPQLLWRLDNTNLLGVGQAWATPVPARINVSGATQNANKLVLVMGGGYEVDQDNVTASTDAAGNSIYIIDSVSGTVLWRGSKSGGNLNFAVSGRAMDYSIPAEVKVVDFDGDGFADRMYAADMGGQVWRFDIYNGQTASNLVTGGVIAKLGSAASAMPTLAETRRFYYSPDVAMVSTKDYNFVHIGIGSGHRAHPLGTATQDRFYALRDYNGQTKLTQTTYDTQTIITEASLTDVTDNISANVPQGSGYNGWKFELRKNGGWTGEKVLAEARTFNNQVFFTTFQPSASGTSCEPQLGKNRLYVMSLFNGAPVTNLDGSTDPTLTDEDRSKEFKGSISSEVVFIFPSPDVTDANNDGVPDACVGDQCTPPPVACVDLFCFPPGFANNPVRTFWTQESVDSD